MEARLRFSVPVGKGVLVDEYCPAFASLLTVVNPSDDRHEIVEDGLFYEAVFSVEADGLRVMFPEQIEGVYDGVGIAEEPEDVLPFLLVHL